MCKRLTRAKVPFSLYWVALGDEERGAIMSVAPEHLDCVPEIDNLTSGTGEQCARKLAHFIDLIPVTLPAGAHRHGSCGPLEWAPELPDDLPDAEADADAEVLNDLADPEEHPFEVSDDPVVVESEDEFVDFLWAIDAEQERRGIPDAERVNPRRGKLDNWHTGGAIEASILWRRPDDPDLIERIRAKLFDLPRIPLLE
jgi:hypothetical protein